MSKGLSDLRICCHPQQVTPDGDVVGTFWVETANICFPWSEYPDALADVVRHWLESARELVAGEPTTEFWFWNKPFYYIGARRTDEWTCQLLAQDKEDDIYFDITVGLDYLRKEVLTAAERVLAVSDRPFSLRGEIQDLAEEVRRMDLAPARPAKPDPAPKTSWLDASEEKLREAVLASSTPGLRDSYGMTALHAAAHNGWVDLARDLLQAGANLDARGRCWWTEEDDLLAPLHLAAWKGRLEVIQLLLTNGADPDCRDGTGGTPLHYAALSGDLESVVVLVEAGGTVSAKDTDNRTALDVAEDEDHVAVAEYLRTFDPTK
jgi:hypothetical protein